ncbi:hypothetical protein [Streptomyces sp. IBSBF 3136]|uniref:hypothetical protein n=1 Tax=Streptomyces sp. IBSBF 3136 TaxID=2903524 RepID=UPI002FDBE07B
MAADGCACPADEGLISVDRTSHRTAATVAPAHEGVRPMEEPEEEEEEQEQRVKAEGVEANE